MSADEDRERIARAELARAQRAHDLLNDPLLRDAFEQLRKTLFEKWMATKDADTAIRERLWIWRQSLDDLQGVLNTVVSTGRLAADELDVLGRRDERERSNAQRDF